MMSHSRGSVIMSCRPFVDILNHNQKGIHCDHCFALNDSLKKCSKCNRNYYCHQKCQKNDWKRFHRNECQLYTDCYVKYLNRDCDRFLLRLFQSLTLNSNKRSLNYESNNGKNRSFDDLMTHYNRIKADTTRMKYFQTICDNFDLCGIIYDNEILFEYFCKICINSFSVLNIDLNEIGTALYISSSVFDHSCQPNAAPVFSGTVLEIRALRDIDENEEIYINYIDLKSNRSERQTKLFDQYYFNCDCSKCLTQSDSNIDYNLVKSLDIQLDQMITNESDWSEAYSIGMESISIYHQIYGDFHPDATVQLMRVLKLKVLVSDNIDEKDTIELIRKIDNCIKITHGIDHNLYKLFKDIVYL